MREKMCSDLVWSSKEAGKFKRNGVGQSWTKKNYSSSLGLVFAICFERKSNIPASSFSLLVPDIVVGGITN
jgi:predicted acetyltransferase